MVRTKIYQSLENKQISPSQGDSANCGFDQSL